jgi:alkylation response protein AidB-like acyl-CoA dehydrogenase
MIPSTTGSIRGVDSIRTYEIRWEMPMKLALSPDEVAFRDELRTFFRTEIPAEIRDKVENGRELSREDIVTAHKLLHAKGIAVPKWPVEWGGQDWTSMQRHIW